jgi:hypothetical protein
MTAPPHLSPTAQKVLEVLRSNPGTAYSATDICELTDCSAGQAQIALDALVGAGLAVPQESTGGAATYVAT